MRRAFNSSVMTVFNEKSEFLSSSFDSEDDTPKTDVRQMEKAVGLVGGISLIVGTMIGSGIFASASAVANYSGSVGMTLLVWVGCGVLSMMASLCYVELCIFTGSFWRNTGFFVHFCLSHYTASGQCSGNPADSR